MNQASNYSGSDPGTRWIDAFKNLQDAIDAVAANNNCVTEIWVAQGTYLPTKDKNGNASPADPRDKTFYINNDGIKIYGGFNGTETMRSQRDWAANVTTLSGDFAVNDEFEISDDGNYFNDGYQNGTGGDNAYHVMYMDGTTTSGNITTATVLDGFVVTGGNANGNFPNNDGGGMFNDGIGTGNECSPTIANCSFSENSAQTQGGGMFNGGVAGKTNPILTNCSFHNNSSLEGGGIYNSGYNTGGMSSPILINCTIYGNSSYRGGGIYCDGDGSGTSSPSLTNSILWGNSASSEGTNIFLQPPADPTYSHSLIEGSGGSGSWNTSFGIDNGNNLDEDPLFVSSNNLRLQNGSPAINSGDGDSGSSANSTTEDLDANPRFFNGGTIDMGAYEFQGTPCPFTTAIYVDIDATSGNNDGTSWTNAYTDLQDAIDNQCGGAEIWVAQGTYLPTRDKNGNASPANPRDKTFYINNDGIKIYGGFAGTETMRSQRDWAANVTTLSGDLVGNDDFELSDDGDYSNDGYQNNTGSDNASHVVYMESTSSSSNITAATVFDGFTVTGGNGDNGGGMFIYSLPSGTCSPTLNNCSFSGNLAGYGGGIAIYNVAGTNNPILTNCSFSNNLASSIGGGMISTNVAGTCNPILTNCSFFRNFTKEINDGGGMSNGHGFGNPGTCIATLTNCSFSKNRTGSNGGGGFRNGANSTAILTNCILWDNPPNSLNNHGGAALTISHSLIQGSGGSGAGWNSSFGTDGGNNLDTDPIFTDPANGDLTLQAGSPAIDAGLNNANSTTEDLAGNPRVFNSTIDMGAYESQGTPCPFTTAIYVDIDATSGNNDGTSWTDAYTDLQDAIDAVAANNNCVTEIWVAQGTYLPTKDKTGNASPANPRTKTFYIDTDGIEIYGGFDGTETLRSQRNWATNVTTLSGDFNGNDVVTGSGSTLSIFGNGENAYHVVYMDGTTTNGNITTATVLDGFTVTRGYADHVTAYYRGGGVYNDGGGSGHVCSPAFNNCRFYANAADSGGGGMYNSCRDYITGTGGGTSSPTLTNCSFENNFSVFSGAGMENYGYQGTSSPTLTDCLFSGNSADRGGGMFNNGAEGTSSPTLTNCSFVNNVARSSDGGGMHLIVTCGPTLTNCSFSGNTAAGEGGGMYLLNSICSPTLTNCSFYGNSAKFGGGMSDTPFPGIVNPPTLTNCSFSGNSATDSGGGIDVGLEITLTNCILWGNTAPDGPNFSFPNGSTPAVTYSIVQGGYAGTGNLDEDPLFTDPANGDLTLQQCSPAINTGDGASGSSANSTTNDLAGNARFYNTGTIDMGAYEYQGTFMACCPFTTAIYVDIDATSGNNDGTSWTDAYTDLQDAIDNQCGGAEIWVAQGTYLPTRDKNGNDNGRYNTFYIATDGIEIYGGFNGTETLRSQRNWATNVTTLSGDHLGNDIFFNINNGYLMGTGNDNAYHVVHMDGTTANGGITSLTVLDGFQVQGGNANWNSPEDRGAGMYNNGGFSSAAVCSPTIANCSFSGNYAQQSGGGMYNNGTLYGNSSPTVTNCSFSGNVASSDGGGMFNEGINGTSAPLLTNCTFSGNTAGSKGGGVYNEGGEASLTGGGGSSKSAPSKGGAAKSFGPSSNPTLLNCVFHNNSAELGGGVYNSEVDAVLTNCTFHGNVAIGLTDFQGNGATGDGGAVYNSYCNPALTNCILWGNGSEIGNENATPTISYSLIEGSGGSGSWNTSFGTDGGNNLDEDPVFVSTTVPNVDLSLQMCSPAIEVGDGNSGSSANSTTEDLAGNPRFYNSGTIDMGAYEYQGAFMVCYAATASATNVSCNGGSDGSVEVTVTGGTAPYSDGTNSYNTNPFTITGLSAGAYAYTITDANGATDGISGTITEPAAVTLSLDNTTNVSCSGGNDGALEVSASGGTLSTNTGLIPSVYISEVGINTPDFIEITSNGTVDVTGYQVVISDNYSNISIANSLTWTLSGTMTANTPVYREDVGGTNYWGNNIFWTTGNSSWAIIIDPAGNIVDAVFWGWSATAIANFSISVGGLTVTNNGAWTGNGLNTSCADSFTRTGTTDTNTDADWTCMPASMGVDNLMLPVVATGNYAYAWSSGQTTDDITGLAAGSYTVTVTDLNGCTDIQTYNVTEPTAITFTAVETACSNGADGAITVTASGGTGALQYSKDNGVTYQASNVLTGLAVGSYDIVVKDANNCTTAAQSVAVSTCYEATATHTNVSCNGGIDGSVEVTVTGGTAPYTVDGVQYNTNPFTITGLSAGAYAYTITDVNGAMDGISGTITEPAAFYVSVDNTTNVSCNGGSDGSITLNTGFNVTEDFENGLSNWTQVASPAATYTISNITPTNGGNSSLSMSGGANGLQSELQYTFNEAVTPTSISFDWQSNVYDSGSAGIILSFGGTPNNSFSDALFNFTPNFTFDTTINIYAASQNTFGSFYTLGQWYHIEVKNFDYTNSTADLYIDGVFQTSFTLGSGNTIERIGIVNFNSPSPSYIDNINVQAVSSSSLTYDWENTANPGTSIGTGSSISNLSAGTYTVTATDANGCTADTTITITEPAAALSATAAQTACSNGSDGTASLSITGGTPPYTYDYTDNGTTYTGIPYASSPSLSGLSVGNVTITVTDANGCIANEDVTIMTCCPFTSGIIYVNHAATGNNDGTSWTDAYTDLQDAIDNQCGGAEIWVAQGTYLPTKDKNGNDSPTDAREKTFYIDTDGIEIYGGFDGTETLRSQRDWAANVTTLSGDFNGNDVVTGSGNTLSISGNGENAYHVVYMDGTIVSGSITTATVFDGFTVIGGNANKVYPNNIGGGMFNDGSDGTCSPTIANCIFSGNSAIISGGGIFNNGTRGTSSPTLTNCSFSRNWASSFGGGMANNGFGGGIGTGSPTLTNCSFSGNFANKGGGMNNLCQNGTSSPTLTNCSFSNNSANYGGGIANDGINCTSSPTLTNCILWGNTAAFGANIYDNNATPTITYSIVQGGFTGTGNLDEDPLFVSATDLSLQQCSPAIEAGLNSANSTMEDLAGNPRTVHTNIDMGAYEYQDALPTAPVANCQATYEVVLDAQGNATIEPSVLNDNSTSDCLVTFSASQTVFDCDDLGGPISVTLTVTSRVGSDGCSTQVTVKDETDPTAECKSHTVQLDANGMASIAPADVFESGMDECGTVAPESVAPSTFTCAEVGMVTVTLTVNDGNGNTKTCDATVTVEDKVAPTATCKDITVQLDANGEATTADDAVNDGSTDACGGLTFATDVTSFNCENLGDNTVTLTVTDANGNPATCDATVTVEDKVAPTVTCKDVSIELTNGEATLDPAQVFDAANSVDNCGGLLTPVSVSPSIFSCQNEGANTVTLTVADPSGNTGTCTATVEVASFLTINSIVSTNETCVGFADGSITISATSGGGQIGYSIDGGDNFQLVNNTFALLTPGTYNIVVKVFGIPGVCEKTGVATVGAGSGQVVWYKDSDGDGYSDGNTVTACSQPAGYIANPLAGTDCNDNNASIHPGATEICDGLDNDCNGSIPASEADNDGDGYRVCDGDCNDSNPNIHPGAAEVCNGLDDNCDGSVDEGLSGETYTGNVAFYTQAQVDAWPPCYSVINGNVMINGAGINNLGPLSNITEITGNLTVQTTGLTSMTGLNSLVEIGGTVTIFFNSSLTTLDGLEALNSVGGSLYIYYNFQLNDCCAIYNLINGGVTGPMVIFYNKVGCNSVVEINSNCQNAPLVGGSGNSTLNSQAAILVEERSLSVYPNPATDVVTVLFDPVATTALLEIRGGLGHLVFVETLGVGADRLDIDLNNQEFANGIYFITLMENGQKSTHKLVVQH